MSEFHLSNSKGSIPLKKHSLAMPKNNPFLYYRARLNSSIRSIWTSLAVNGEKQELRWAPESLHWIYSPIFSTSVMMMMSVNAASQLFVTQPAECSGFCCGFSSSSSNLAADITRNFTLVNAPPEIWSVAHKQVVWKLVRSCSSAPQCL